MKRLRGAVGYMALVSSQVSPAPPRPFKNTVNPPPLKCCETSPNVERHSEFGLSRIQRPASFYTDYIAAAKAKYVLQTPADSCGDNGAKALKAYSICSCAIEAVDIIQHNGVCVKCKYSNIVKR
jgi:hypothetical protein